METLNLLQRVESMHETQAGFCLLFYIVTNSFFFVTQLYSNKGSPLKVPKNASQEIHTRYIQYINKHFSIKWFTNG